MSPSRLLVEGRAQTNLDYQGLTSRIFWIYIHDKYIVHINWYVKQITPVTLYKLDHTYISAWIKAQTCLNHVIVMKKYWDIYIPYLTRNTFFRHHVHQQRKLLYSFPHIILMYKIQITQPTFDCSFIRMNVQI